MSEAATSKEDLIKTLHKEVKERIEKQNFKDDSRINKRRKEIIFQLGDYVWIHFRKERFSSQMKTKLHSRRMTLIKSLKELITMHIKLTFSEFITFYFQCC